MKVPSYLKTKNTDSLLLLLALLVLVAIAALNIATNKGISFLQTSNRNSANAYVLKDKMQQLLSDVLFMETAQRGNIISNNFDEGKELQAVDNVETDLRELQPLVYEQIDREYDQLAFFVNRRIKFSNLVTSAYKRGGKQEAEALINTMIGDQIRDSIYKYATRLETEFGRNVQVNLEANYKRSEKLKPVISILSILSFIVIVALSIRVIFKINHKNKLIRKLRIAHRKQIIAKKQLQAAKKEAESIATLKQNFLANMSHEIRTPINAVIGFSNILQKTRLTKEQKKFVKLIQNSGNSLLSLVNDILDFSKIEAGMVKIEKIEFDLRDLCNSIVTMFQAQAKEKGIGLSLNINENCPNALIGDPLRITQILTNLISNALKFTEKGSVEITVSLLEKTNDDCVLRYVVRDTGIGMSEAQLNRVFDRFDQGENDIARKFGGTGLGLAIVKNLVELQKGIIKVESRVEVGSTFIFELPFAIQSQVIKPLDKTETHLHIDKELRLLVVDDNEINLMLVEYLLSDWGVYFETARTGKEAIEKLSAKSFDLVLMDIQMPEMDGYTATEYIRNELKSDIPVVAMTAHVLPGEQERCKAHGMNDYISKPLQEEVLQKVLKKFSGRTPVRSPQVGEQFVDQEMIYNKFSGNNEFINRIIRKALLQFAEEREKLNEIVSEQDPARLMEMAHKMRSTVSLLHHHSPLVSWLTDMELLAGESYVNWEQINSLVQKLEGGAKQLNEEADALLQDMKLAG